MSDRDEPRTVAGQDWMPTDEEIRDQVKWEFSGEKEATAGAAFDRWLAGVKREAAAEALEDAAKDPTGLLGVGPGDWRPAVTIGELNARANELRKQVTE